MQIQILLSHAESGINMPELEHEESSRLYAL